MWFREMPLIVELLAQASHECILIVLDTRFGAVPPEIGLSLQNVLEESKLSELTRLAAVCPDLAIFQARLAELVSESREPDDNEEEAADEPALVTVRPRLAMKPHE